MTPNELVLTFGGLHVCVQMRPGKCPQTDTHTHGQTQNDFIICPMLYAIAMGQIIKCRLRESNSDTVTHRSTNRAQRRLTSLIETNALPLRQTVILNHRTNNDKSLCYGSFQLLQLKFGTVCQRPSSHRHHCSLSGVN